MDWQSKLENDIRFSLIKTIPCTHHSAMNKAFFCKDFMKNRLFASQSVSIKEQLNMGIRGIHLNMKEYNEGIYMYDGYLSHDSLIDVLCEVNDFLSVYFNEFIFVFVTLDKGFNVGCVDKIWNCFEKVGDRLMKNDKNIFTKKVGELRGKIIPVIGNEIKRPSFGYIQYTNIHDVYFSSISSKQIEKEVNTKTKTMRFNTIRRVNYFIESNYVPTYWVNKLILENIKGVWKSKCWGFLCLKNVNKELVHALLYS